MFLYTIYLAYGSRPTQLINELSPIESNHNNQFNKLSDRAVFKASDLSSQSYHKLTAVINSLNKTVSLNIKDVLLGILDTSNTSILVNYIVLESKFFYLPL